MAENNDSNHIRHDFLFVIRAKIQKRVSSFSDKLGFRSFHPEDFQVTHICVKIPNLASSFANYRIVHISDIHFGQWISSERLTGVVELINELEPDAVAITGDFVSYYIDESTLQMVSYLSKLKPHDVSVAVLGNHDHWAGAVAVREILAKSNICDVSDDVYVVSRGDATLSLAGVDGAYQKRDFFDVVLKKMPPGPAVLLAHEPDFADKSSSTNRFSLQLSGHSHGGQIVIPGFGTPVRGPGFMKYPLGEYKVGNMVLYVNRGLGTNAYWFRINAPPEIAVITLEAA